MRSAVRRRASKEAISGAGEAATAVSAISFKRSARDYIAQAPVAPEVQNPLPRIARMSRIKNDRAVKTKKEIRVICEIRGQWFPRPLRIPIDCARSLD